MLSSESTCLCCPCAAKLGEQCSDVIGATNNCSNKTMNRRPRRGLFPTNRCERDDETGEENQGGPMYLPDNSVLF